MDNLKKFQLKTLEIKNSIKGGQGAPVKNFLEIDGGTKTNGGEACIMGGCHAYSSDTIYSDGGIEYEISHPVNKPC